MKAIVSDSSDYYKMESYFIRTLTPVKDINKLIFKHVDYFDFHKRLCYYRYCDYILKNECLLQKKCYYVVNFGTYSLESQFEVTRKGMNNHLSVSNSRYNPNFQCVVCSNPSFFTAAGEFFFDEPTMTPVYNSIRQQRNHSQAYIFPCKSQTKITDHLLTNRHFTIMFKRNYRKKELSLKSKQRRNKKRKLNYLKKKRHY